MQRFLGGAFDDTKTFSENLAQIVCFTNIMGRRDFKSNEILGVQGASVIGGLFRLL